MENENLKNYPYGRKAAEGFAIRGMHDPNNHVSTREIEPGITGMMPMNADPHGRGFRAPVHVEPGAARTAPNDMGPGLLPANGCINSNPHPYNPSSSVKLPNTYARPVFEKRR
jgi:hypothetical protein